MSSVRELHLESMEFVDRAVAAQRRGESLAAADLFRQAMERERSAALLVPADIDSEPTRSVLCRSAAELALDAGDHREAERLASLGLAGYPPGELADELRDLLQRVQFHRHLDLRGIELERTELQFSIAGTAVSHGMVISSEFTRRVEHVRALVRRTFERQIGMEFREAGPGNRLVQNETEVYLSEARAASFATTFRIGRSRDAIPLDLGEPLPEIVPEILGCLGLASEGQYEALEKRINNPAYFRNCVGLIRQIAPDGQNVTLVGFTAQIGGHETRVQLGASAAAIPLPPGVSPTAAAGSLVSVTGQLRYANSIAEQQETIKIVDADGRAHNIRVDEGIGDIVKPYWGQAVTIQGYRDGKWIRLTHLRSAELERGLDLFGSEHAA